MSDQSDALPWRLPKLVESDPRAEALNQQLLACSQPLWPGARLTAISLEPNEELREALVEAKRAGHVVRGLDACDEALDAEARGMRLADERSQVIRQVRVSRLLILSDDGAERFYRQAERTLARHEGRVLAVRLAISADELGLLLFGPDRVTRAVMLTHKASVAAALLAVGP